MANKIKRDLELQIIEYYKKEPISIREVSKKFNICCPTLSKILKNANIEIYSKQEINNKNTFVDYFENIDNEEKAYFLGLLIADGCVFKYRKNTMFVILSLQEQDSYMVELFAKKTNASRKIIIDKRDNSKSITITSNKMARDLSKYGVVEHKTFITYLPELNSIYMPHLLRGILDGDGNVGMRLRKLGSNNLRWQIAFCGNKELMINIRNFLCATLWVANVKVCKEQSIYSIRWTSKSDFYTLCKYFYADATIFLNRKKEIYNYFCNLYCN